MKWLNKYLFSFFLVTISLQAQTKLPAFFADNMVLQQKDKVAIWGNDVPNTAIKISTSWGSKAKAITDKNGIWKTKIKTKKASFNPENITILGSKTITLKNILIGEVWLCSGQSNMDMPMNGLRQSKVLNAEIFLEKAKNKNIRLFNNSKAASTMPDFETGGKWTMSNRTSAQQFSAIGFIFAQQLYEKLNVPIGIIETAWGGTRIESWLPKEYLLKYKDVIIPKKLPETQKKQKKPSFLYNAMIHPFQDFKIKGVLWYQGESNRTKPKPYYNLMSDLIQSWRTQWNNKYLPFYFVQIAPYNYVKHKRGKRNYANFIREAQLKVSKTIKNTGLVAITDLGDCNDIHPSKKGEVAKRLASWALAKHYGFRKLNYKSATFKSMKIQDNKIKLDFEFCNRDFFLDSKNVNGFTIAGADKVFFPAKVMVNKNNKSLILHHPKIEKPVAVRYGFEDCFESNLQTKSKLPIAVFRTDSW